jgi:hypothetical protein
MIQINGQIETITCDKCGHQDSYGLSIAGEMFFELGWSLNSRAKKYKHLCRNCQTPKQRKAYDFDFGKLNHEKKRKKVVVCGRSGKALGMVEKIKAELPGCEVMTESEAKAKGMFGSVKSIELEYKKTQEQLKNLHDHFSKMSLSEIMNQSFNANRNSNDDL